MARQTLSVRVFNCQMCGVPIPGMTKKKQFCKECLKARKAVCDSRYYRENIEAVKRKVRIWERNNGARIKQVRLKLIASNPEHYELAAKKKYARHKEKRCLEAREWYAANREKVLARMSTEEGRRKSRERMRGRLKDPHLKLHSVISHSIRISIKDKKRRRWETLVGYSLEQLIDHLERQFTRGMRWENHGRGDGCWHIDHIVPRAAFRYETADDPDFKACWALTNLRPLWQKENISKHASREFLL